MVFTLSGHLSLKLNCVGDCFSLSSGLQSSHRKTVAPPCMESNADTLVTKLLCSNYCNVCNALFATVFQSKVIKASWSKNVKLGNLPESRAISPACGIRCVDANLAVLASETTHVVPAVWPISRTGRYNRFLPRWLTDPTFRPSRNPMHFR